MIVGLGNPILSDDAVGLLILDQLKKKYEGTGPVFQRASSGGLALVDLVTGFDEAVLIDSILTGSYPPGTLLMLTPEDFSETRHISNMHDINFATAVKIGESMGVKLPAKFTIYAVEVKEVLEFGENLTKEVSDNIEKIIQEIEKREFQK